MIRLAALATLAAALAAPAAAQTPDTAEAYVARFERFCLATDGDFARAGAAAQAEGWIPAPQSMLDEMRNEKAPDVAIWLSGPAESSPDRLLLSGSPPMEGRPELTVRACGIEPAAPGYSLTDLATLAQGKLGLPPAVPGLWLYSGRGPYADESALIMGGSDAVAERAMQDPIYMLHVLPDEAGVGALAVLRMGR